MKRIKYIKSVSEQKVLPKKRKLYELCKTYRNSLNKINNLSKPNYYYQFFEENKRKLNKVWQEIKEITDSSKMNI